MTPFSQSNQVVVYAFEKGYRILPNGDVLSPHNTKRKTVIRKGYVAFKKIMNNMQTEIVRDFKNKTGYTLEVKNGKLHYGGSLYLIGTGITDRSKVNRNTPNFFEWRNREYIKVDGIFSKVVSCRGNVYKICQIGESKERYLVTDGVGKWSHGDTLKEAKDDLIYKISNRDKSEYDNLTLESELTFAEAIEAYRVITGAYSVGTKMFVKNELSERKEKYTISEIIRITKGQYNSNVFERFFEK